MDWHLTQGSGWGAGEICKSLMGRLARMQTLPSYVYTKSSLFSRLRFTLKIRSELGIGNRCAHNIVRVIQ